MKFTVRDSICLVSPHEKGFWQADIYFEGWDEGGSDHFFTGEIGGTKEQIIMAVNKRYPQIKIFDGVTGICTECNKEFFLLESECNCGGVVGET